MTKLEDAILLAVKNHKGQIDKAGQPYILHPLRLILKMDTEEERIVAVLHDIIEDTPVTINELQEKGFSERIVDAVVCLTKKDGERYNEYIERVATNPLAKKVKLADLEDNINLTRLPTV